jgi:translation initiation factor 1 (eIF-1/SUI1)
MFTPFAMNEFNDTSLNNIDSLLDDINHKITIFTRQNGKKHNTYIVGWNINESDLKAHLKTLKTTNGCNGSIKTIEFEGKQQPAIHLQGNKLDIVKEYLVNIAKMSIDDLVIKD